MAVMIGSQMLGLANRSSSDFDADTAEQLYSAILQSFVIISLRLKIISIKISYDENTVIRKQS